MTPFAGGPASWSELGVRCQLGLEESSMSSMGGDDVGPRLKALSICCGATANQRCYVGKHETVLSIVYDCVYYTVLDCPLEAKKVHS